MKQRSLMQLREAQLQIPTYQAPPVPGPAPMEQPLLMAAFSSRPFRRQVGIRPFELDVQRLAWLGSAPFIHGPRRSLRLQVAGAAAVAAWVAVMIVSYSA